MYDHVIAWLYMGFRLGTEFIELLSNSWLRFTTAVTHRLVSVTVFTAPLNIVASLTSLSNGSCPWWLAPFTCSSPPELTHKVKVMLWTMASWPVYLGVKPHLDLVQDFLLLWDSLCFVDIPSLIRGWVCHLQIPAGPHQHVHLRIQAPWDSWQYFTKNIISSLYDLNTDNIENTLPTFLLFT